MTHGRPYADVSPLLPPPARRLAVIVLCSAVAVLAGGAVLVHGQYSDPLDRRVDLWAMAHLGGHGEALHLVADLGQKVGVTVIIAVICVACLAARRANGAVLAVVGAPVAAVVTEKILKPLAGHLYVNASYPSGHTTSFFALITTVAVLLTGAPASKVRPAVRIAIVATGVLIGCAIGLAVIALGDHRFIDTVGGAAVGIAVVLLVTLLLDLPAGRRLLGLVWPARLARRAPGGAREAAAPPADLSASRGNSCA
jgi:membrane-associated phospholipid phosphatase